jgi:hypothetical protein
VRFRRVGRGHARCCGIAAGAMLGRVLMFLLKALVAVWILTGPWDTRG